MPAARAGVPHAVDRALDVDRVHLVGLDRRDGLVGVRLVLLDAGRQPDRHERGIAALGPHRSHAELAQPSGHRGVDAAGDAEHQALGAGVLHVLREEPDAALGLAGGVEVGDDLEVLDDPLLGVPSVMGRG